MSNSTLRVTGPAVADAEVVTVRPRIVIGVRDVVRVGRLREFVARSRPFVTQDLRRLGITPSGPPIAVFRQLDGATYEVVSGWAVGRAPAPGTALVSCLLPGGRAARSVHLGDHAAIGCTYDRLVEWMAGHFLHPASTMWEEYLIGPDVTDDRTRWRTRIVCPLCPG